MSASFAPAHTGHVNDMGLNLLKGAAAGAAGATALNAVTYLDMAVRGRGASDTPQQTVDTLAGKADLEVPGEGDTRDNRLAGLGSLSGIVTGVGVGAAFGLLRRAGFRPPALIGGALVGLAAMAATDGTMAALEVSDPRTWSPADWASDLVPHLIYGLVTYATLQRLDR
jgi:hypothetical protein